MNRPSKNEPLVDVRKYVRGAVIALDPERMKIERTARLRKTVAQMLAEAQRKLPKGYQFIIRDAWRPKYVQMALFDELLERFKKTHPNWSQQKLLNETKKFVGPWEGKLASGHMTGGAVDLRIVDARGHRVPMRSLKLSYQENAAPDHPKLPNSIRKNRKMLQDAMSGAGFSNHPLEFWHWSYGDIHWALREKKKVIYGVVSNEKK